VYGNLIKKTTVRNQINGNHNSFHYNIIDTITNSPFKKSGTAQGVDLQGYKPYVCHDNKIYNNVIYNCDEAGIRLRDIYGPQEKRNNSICNNIIMDCGKTSKDGLPYALVVDAGTTIKGNTYKNNCVYNTSSLKVLYYRGQPMTISEFNSHKGTSGDVIKNNIGLDPLFMDLANHTFTLQNDSPCINSAVNVGLTKDYEGNLVPQGDGIDIGAFEYRLITLPETPKSLPVLR
jgi:hypothetical protein